MKQKSHSGTKKRVKLTGSGKIRMEKGSKRHLLVNKSKRQKNIGGNKVVIAKADLKRFHLLLAK
jgi:large subunit ribosomal protein L35